MDTPSYIEDHISQIPALKFLMSMGWQYLTPDQALDARGGRTSNVLLDDILKEQLGKLNKIEYKQKEYAFSDANINAAILELRDLPEQDGFIAANKFYYELITLGKSFEQSINGDKKSFSFQYIDWKSLENNSYHVTEEYSVMRPGRTDHYRPDIVLFVNGIPMVVIECKSPKLKEPVKLAIEQHIRNQEEDGIRNLYSYSNILLSLATNDAKYATTGTSKEFWSYWKEIFKTKEEERLWDAKIIEIKNKNLDHDERAILFKDRYRNVWYMFDKLESEDQAVSAQDRLLYSLCRPERLLDLLYNYTLYDEGIKKIARYQQYYAIESTIAKVTKVDESGKHPGGVIWHTQGSGKSLTMVMLAQQLAINKSIKDPKIILVTDRVELDDQITETFKKCNVAVKNAKSGKDLVKLLKEPGDSVITTLIHKFEAAVSKIKSGFDSPEIFVLVDEGHRSQYGTFNVKMRKVFPNACFIAFTGTPLMKREKSTATKFGGLIDVYSITDAVADGAVVPLLYEGRHNLIQVNESPLDTYFDKVSEPLTKYGKADLKRKFSTKNILNKADQVIYARAWDISEYFENNIQGILFGSLKAKGQLVAPNKATALQYREYIKGIGKVSCEVLISDSDDRENHDDAFEVTDDAVLKFMKAMKDKYGSVDNYETELVKSFKKKDHPEIIIVVDKLLTGFDAPNNCVMFLTRQLKEHTLLQAIARVNRLAPGKEYGYIIDYYGNLENLDSALITYGGNTFDSEDLEGTWTNLSEEIKKLPQAHSELWDIFKSIKNKYDNEAYEMLLADESVRHLFYEKLSIYARLLKLALSSFEYNQHTPEAQIDKYKKDAKFFLGLRVSVKRRYFDAIDYKDYETQVQKLIDKHITTDGEVLKVTDMVNIFDKEERQAEVEKLTSKSAQADHIASRTIRAINIKMDDDPIFHRKLSTLIRQTIEDYHQQRIDEAAFLKKVKEYEAQFFDGKRDDVPEQLKGNENGLSIYNLVKDVLKDELSKKEKAAVEIALGIDRVIRSILFENNVLIIDWQNKLDIEGAIRMGIDDYIFELKDSMGIDFDFNKIDLLVEDALKVARAKFK